MSTPPNTIKMFVSRDITKLRAENIIIAPYNIMALQTSVPGGKFRRTEVALYWTITTTPLTHPSSPPSPEISDLGKNRSGKVGDGNKVIFRQVCG